VTIFFNSAGLYKKWKIIETPILRKNHIAHGEKPMGLWAMKRLDNIHF
jgi:hypothetical protein